MRKLAFNKNPHLSIGVEIEIQVVDPVTGDLKPSAPIILQKIKTDYKNPHIKSELFQSMLEIDTPICANAHEISHSLTDSLSLARKVAEEFHCQIMMAGTHPFAHYSERLLTPSSRYHDLVDRNQWITRRLQIFGLHIHLGMKSGEHAIAMNNALCHYLPMLLALSASSPFWNKMDTGLASSRITFFEAIPTGGHPYLLNSWTEFEQLVEKLIFSRSIKSIKDLWWDIRPNTEYGTIEVRIADCPPTLQETTALVSFVHCLATFLDEEIMAGRKFSPPPEWILRENKWRASRHGIQCDLITNLEGGSFPFKDVWQLTRKNLDSSCKKYHYEDFFNFIDLMIKNGPSYLRQRNYVKEGFEKLVKHLIRENETDQPEWDIPSQ